MANFFKDNPNLRRRLERTPWEQFLPALERDFTDQSELAPSNLDEAKELITDVLETVGEICANEIAPHAAEVDRVGSRLENGEVIYPEPMQRAFKTLADAGLMGLTLPREFGGLNFPMTAYTAAVEMISRADAALMTVYALQGCGDTIHRYGARELHEKYLPGICSGELTACMALTEPHAGSALDAVTTRATEQEDGTWRVRGSKCFITNGGADVLLVLARSEEDRSGGYGLSLFVAEKGEGIEVAKLEDKLGIHGSPTAVVNFNDAPAVLLGGRGSGLYTVGMSLLYNARLEVAAQAVGIAQAAQTAAVRYAHEREQFKRAIDHFPAVRMMLFESAAEIEAARALVMTTASVVDRQHGQKFRQAEEKDTDRLRQVADILTPLAKYYASEMANRVASRALQVHGGYGYMREYPVERHLRDARITNIYEGTSEIQVSMMIGPLLQRGLPLLFEQRLESAREVPGAKGAVDLLRGSYETLLRCVQDVRAVGKHAYRGWAKLFADATADLYTALVFLDDAQQDERAAVLALHQARSAHRHARNLDETIQAKDTLSFETESFERVIESYRA